VPATVRISLQQGEWYRFEGCEEEYGNGYSEGIHSQEMPI